MRCEGCGNDAVLLDGSGYCSRCAAVIRPIGDGASGKRGARVSSDAPIAKRYCEKPGPAPSKPLVSPRLPPVEQDVFGSIPRQAHIHPGDLRVGLFNIQDLGGGPARSAQRTKAEITNLAKVIARAEADIVIILEVKLAPGTQYSPVQGILKKIEHYLASKASTRVSRFSKPEDRLPGLDDHIEKEIQLFFKKYSDEVPLSEAKIISDVIENDGKAAIELLKRYIRVTTKKASVNPDDMVLDGSGLDEVQRIYRALKKLGCCYTYPVVHEDTGGELVLAFYRVDILSLMSFERVDKAHFHGRCPMLFKFLNLKNHRIINVIGWHAPYTDMSARERGYVLLQRFVSGSLGSDEPLLIVGDFNTQKIQHFSAIKKMAASGSNHTTETLGMGTTVSPLSKSMLSGTPKTHVRNHYDHCFLAHVGMPKIFIADYETVSPIVDGVVLSDHCLIVVSLRDGGRSLEEPVLPTTSGKKPKLDRASSLPFGPFE